MQLLYHQSYQTSWTQLKLWPCRALKTSFDGEDRRLFSPVNRTKTWAAAKRCWENSKVQSRHLSDVRVVWRQTCCQTADICLMQPLSLILWCLVLKDLYICPNLRKTVCKERNICPECNFLDFSQSVFLIAVLKYQKVSSRLHHVASSRGLRKAGCFIFRRELWRGPRLMWTRTRVTDA